MAGKLTATVTLPEPRTVSSRGSGSLTASPFAKYPRSAATSGRGVVKAAAFRKASSAAAVHGRGVLTIPTTQQIYNIAGPPAGNGALAGAGFPKYLLPGSVAGNGNMQSTAVPVVQFDNTSFPNAYGYNSSFTMTVKSVGFGMLILPILTYGSNNAATTVSFGAIPAQGGGSQSSLTRIFSYYIGSNLGSLSIFYGVGNWNNVTLTAYTSAVNYYAAIGLVYLNATSITLLTQSIQQYTTSLNLLTNQAESSPTYTGVNMWGVYSGGTAYMLGQSAGNTQATSRGVQTEGSLSIGCQDMGPQNANEYAGFACTQGAYAAAASYLLHA